MRFQILIFFLFAGFFVFSQGHSIEINVKGWEEDSVLLGYHFGDKRFSLDTLVVDNGRMVFQGEETLDPGIYFLYAPEFYFEFLIVEQKFKLSFDRSDVYETINIEGSQENDIFKTFQKTMGYYQRSSRRLQDSLKNVSSEDTAFIQERIRAIKLESAGFSKGMIEKYPDSWFTRMIRMISGNPIPELLEIPDDEKPQARLNFLRENYFKGFENPKEFMRTPTFQNYVKAYFDQIVHQAPDSLIRRLDIFLENAAKDEDTFRFWITHFLTHYQKSRVMVQDAVYIHLIENYCLKDKTPWMSDEVMKDLREEVIFIKPGLIGKTARPFQAVDTLNNSQDFRKYNNKFLVLFFYDPNCGHCKKEAPKLNSHYKEIKNMGGEIVGICTSTIVDDWKEFIKTHGLEWKHLADPTGKSRFRVDYNVRTTPQLYILDEENVIVGKNINIEEQLMNFLVQLFGHNLK